MSTEHIYSIQVENLAKAYGQAVAVNSISFEVHSGELFGFLGPNGAGKTTTIQMLTGLARPDAGSIRIAGIDCSKHPKAAQHLMGIVPDESNLYPELTGFENLCFCGALYGMSKEARQKRAGELLERFGLSEAAHRKFGGYSKGMKRKLTIAAGIIHAPAILFLDEPTTGIDVAGARQIRQHIADLHAAGTTIFLTTHYIEEAQRLCRRIAFIVKGQIVRTDTIENLMRPINGRFVMEFVFTQSAVAGLCEVISGQFSHLRCRIAAANTLRVESSELIRIGPLLRFIEDCGAEVAEARKIQSSLEDVFVDITGIEAGIMKQEQSKKGGNQ